MGLRSKLSISASAARAGAGAMINRPKTINVETVHHARRSIATSPIFMLAFGQSMSAYSRLTDLARPFEGSRTALKECRLVAHRVISLRYGIRSLPGHSANQARFMCARALGLAD